MKKEQQLTNLKLSKKLKKLNCKQDSLWYWANGKHIGLNEWIICSKEANYKNKISAFTVAELGEIMKQQRIGTYLFFPKYKGNGIWCAIRGIRTLKAKTEANARAKLAIHLLEKKIIK